MNYDTHAPFEIRIKVTEFLANSLVAIKMKFACATVVLLATILGAQSVDWESVKNLNIEAPMAKLRGATLPNGRITGGQIAEPNQFPYQVGLLLYVDGGAAWCGGTIISDRWIITAAHCTDSLTTGVDVYLGAHDRKNPKEVGQQIIFVEKKNVIVHEKWDADAISDDISLIKLPVPIEFNKYIQPANLPVKSNSYNTYSGENAIASGWGRTSDAELGATDILQYAKVPIMTNSGCSPWYLGMVSASNICIKTSGGISTCNGDSGGPLVLDDGSNTLIGATSFGIVFGCELGWPGVFTRITYYLDWIEEKTGVANYGN
ncbi:brachyurin [Drosophila erecta]|uniref:Peptidase S1 domain-containing protein n=1 Tax=Drosophila erecta TaxID=7220 RepID=B3NCD0_DROER|nr:brachyurin [Drosophila erecta]EDV51088.2 uncharacterized protein Dere_GG14091 [Drosophila erecta]